MEENKMMILEASELGQGPEVNSAGVEVRIPLRDLQKIVDELEVPKEQYLNAQARNIAQILRKNPKNFETFGMYWFHIKELLQKRAPNSTAWWSGPYRNDYIYECSERGDELLNVLQAVLYYQDNWTKNPEQYFVRNGDSWQYSAFDEDYMNRI